MEVAAVGAPVELLRKRVPVTARSRLLVLLALSIQLTHQLPKSWLHPRLLMLCLMRIVITGQEVVMPRFLPTAAATNGSWTHGMLHRTPTHHQRLLDQSILSLDLAHPLHSIFSVVAIRLDHPQAIPLVAQVPTSVPKVKGETLHAGTHLPVVHRLSLVILPDVIGSRLSNLNLQHIRVVNHAK